MLWSILRLIQNDALGFPKENWPFQKNSTVEDGLCISKPIRKKEIPFCGPDTIFLVFFSDSASDFRAVIPE